MEYLLAEELIALKKDNFTYINTEASPFLSQSGFASVAMIVLPKKGNIVGICPDFERLAVEAEGMVSEWHDYPVWIYLDDPFSREKKSISGTLFQHCPHIGYSPEVSLFHRSEQTGFLRGLRRFPGDHVKLEQLHLLVNDDGL